MSTKPREKKSFIDLLSWKNGITTLGVLLLGVLGINLDLLIDPLKVLLVLNGISLSFGFIWFGIFQRSAQDQLIETDKQR